VVQRRAPTQAPSLHRRDDLSDGKKALQEALNVKKINFVVKFDNTDGVGVFGSDNNVNDDDWEMPVFSDE